MLSRVANHLFWISRSMERAENIARLIDAARRMVSLPVKTVRDLTNEWSSILIAAGSEENFEGDLQTAERDAVLEFLIADPENPSSVFSSFRNARENARAIRFGVTSEVWNALNSIWNEMPKQIASFRARRAYLSEFIDWVKVSQAHYRGAAEATMLRNDSLEFLRLGSQIERADATARLLDVKYHVLLPSIDAIGGGLDQYHWVSLLQAAGMQRAYHFATHSDVSREGVAGFLMLNEVNPRSITHCYSRVVVSLRTLEHFYERPYPSCELAEKMLSDLRAMEISEIINSGLHEHLTRLVEENAQLSQAIGDDFVF